MKATIHNAEIRGFEKKTNKQGDPYLLVRVEDSTGKTEELVDKDMSRETVYHRGLQADIGISINIGHSRTGNSYTTIRIEDVEPVED